jgi:hypothetical protein
MTEAELKKHLDAAEKSPKEIAAAVSGLSEQILRYKPSPDKWCVLEILGHLADVEIIYGYRLRQMLADTKHVIAPLDQNAWARNLNYLDSPPSELVAFYGLHAITTCACCEILRPPTFPNRHFIRKCNGK